MVLSALCPPAPSTPCPRAPSNGSGPATPYGKRGFFWDAWAHGGDDWHRVEVKASQCERIDPEFLEAERRALGEAFYRQEYECSFEQQEGLVYPDFASKVAAPAGAIEPQGRAVGGMDFGFRNPFAAVWGVLDREGVLWLTGERYRRGLPLSEHAQHLPKEVEWYADPAGANEIVELRCVGFCMKRGNNAMRLGITAVHRRLNAGLLRVLPGRCPNLLREAGLYRYTTGGEAGRDREAPLDEHNHALAALRYLVARLDERQQVAGPAVVPVEAPPVRRAWWEDDEEHDPRWVRIA